MPENKELNPEEFDSNLQAVKLREIKDPKFFQKREIWGIGRTEEEIAGKIILLRGGLPLRIFNDWLQYGLRPVFGFMGHHKPLKEGSRHPEVISFTAEYIKDMIPNIPRKNQFMVGLDPTKVAAHGELFYQTEDFETPDGKIMDLSDLKIQRGKASKATDNLINFNEVQFQPTKEFPTVPAEWVITLSLPVLNNEKFKHYLDLLIQHDLRILVCRDFIFL